MTESTDNPRSVTDGNPLKPFQRATVRHALERLQDPTGPRRFLVADEVGLGKTLVAKGVLEALCAANPGRTLNVFYVCSSLSIAHQNADQLLRGYSGEQQERMRVPVDRLTLLPTAERRVEQGDPFRLFTLTPGTLPGSRRAGTVDERALLMVLVHELFPEFRYRFPRGRGQFWRAMQDQAEKSFEGRYDAVLHEYQGRLGKLLDNLRRHLINQLNAAFPSQEPLKQSCWSKTLVERLLDLAARDPKNTIAGMRIALCRAALDGLKADFIILDEFQRFFEFLRGPDPEDADAELDNTAEDVPDSAAHQLMRQLMTSNRDSDDRTRLLLLSATPYRLYGAWRAGDAGQHHQEFYELLRFLFNKRGPERAQWFRQEFETYQRLLRHASPCEGETESLARRIRLALQEVMVRTERQSYGGGTRQSRPNVHVCDLEPVDVFAFHHLHGAALDDHKCMAESFWSSIPYPIQMMPQGEYKFSRGVWQNQPKKPRSAAARAAFLKRHQVRAYNEPRAPHPRLRHFSTELGEHLLRLPWLPPTLPWWPLGGLFAEAQQATGNPLSKVLVFSQYRAVPRAVSALLSFRAERMSFESAKGPDGGFDYFARRDNTKKPAEGLRAQPAASFGLSETDERGHRSVVMFWPFPWLAQLGDPMKLSGFTERTLDFGDAKRQVSARLREALPAAAVGARSPALWRVVAALEARNNAQFEELIDGWGASAEKGLAGTLAGLRKAAKAPLPDCPDELIEELAELALAAPGNVLWRALMRAVPHYDGVPLAIATSKVSGHGLRGYFDTPEFHVLLGDGSFRDHPTAVRRAVWEGNLESVFDEYIATAVGLGSAAASRDLQPFLKRLGAALGIRAASLEVQHAGTGTPFRMRAHAALPLGLQLRDEGSADMIRTDYLRQAFNSPFRPHVLTTTSIGQEGLDFHVYCNHIVHWDLPSNPVDLEQRDGRVNRYGGLAVRRQMARAVLSEPLTTGSSPWIALSSRQMEDASGLTPWWGMAGAETRRTIFVLPLSRVHGELDELLSALSLYRLTLGQVDQERLLMALERRIGETNSEEQRRELLDWFEKVRIDLAPTLE